MADIEGVLVMTREHWLQILAIVVPILMTIGGGIWFLSTDIEGVRQLSMLSVAQLAAKVSADEERLAAMEKIEAGHYTDEVAFRAEMRSAINNVISGLADVRVAVGSRNHSTSTR